MASSHNPGQTCVTQVLVAICVFPLTPTFQNQARNVVTVVCSASKTIDADFSFGSTRYCAMVALDPARSLILRPQSRKAPATPCSASQFAFRTRCNKRESYQGSQKTRSARLQRLRQSKNRHRRRHVTEIEGIRAHQVEGKGRQGVPHLVIYPAE